jgi:hypothetical protein
MEKRGEFGDRVIAETRQRDELRVSSRDDSLVDRLIEERARLVRCRIVAGGLELQALDRNDGWARPAHSSLQPLPGVEEQVGSDSMRTAFEGVSPDAFVCERDHEARRVFARGRGDTRVATCEPSHTGHHSLEERAGSEVVDVGTTSERDEHLV